MKKKIKVLMVLSTFGSSSGVTSFAVNYLRSMDHSRVQMDFVSYQDMASDYIREIETRGGKAFVLPSVKHPVHHLAQCRKILREGHYDLIHNNIGVLSIPLMLMAKMEKISIRILHSHSVKLAETKTKENRNRLFFPFLKRLANQYLACSNAAGNALFPHDSFTVIPNVIDSTFFKYQESVREQVRNENGVLDKKVILTVGRASEVKNPFFAMDVIAELVKIQTNVEYWWAGEGPLESAMREYAEQKGIMEQVRILGGRDDVKQLYQAADVFFLPSVFEGLPLTCLEAQAAGVPLVLSDSITKELVFTDLVQYVNLEEPPALWAKKLKEALSRTTERSQYANQLEESIYSASSAGTRLYDVYVKMIG